MRAAADDDRHANMDMPKRTLWTLKAAPKAPELPGCA